MSRRCVKLVTSFNDVPIRAIVRLRVIHVPDVPPAERAVVGRLAVEDSVAVVCWDTEWEKANMAKEACTLVSATCRNTTRIFQIPTAITTFIRTTIRPF